VVLLRTSFYNGFTFQYSWRTALKVKMILPALVEARGLYWRPIKYSLFPPLGLATLAGYLPKDWDIELQDEHVEKLHLDDSPDLVVIQVYITSATRAYEIADLYRRKGSYVVLGGLHATSLPNEAAQHADTIFIGPGEDTWPEFIHDFQHGCQKKRYISHQRTLIGMPRPRRDLIKRHLYLVPNSIVVSRGCPHRCDFCYKEAFFKGGKSFYTQQVDAALDEIESLPGRHLYFLDDHLLGHVKFASALFEGMRGMGRLWQAAATVNSILIPGLLETAVESGLRSLFVGFETINSSNLHKVSKVQNLNQDYDKVIKRLHGLGVMINGSFVFGMDDDQPSVFDQTVTWAIERGIETATFHILTPYPSTALYHRFNQQKRIHHHNWDLYDTRHAVFSPARMTPEVLEAGYWRAYKKFYTWKSILSAASTKDSLLQMARHLAYAGGWKKFEPVWNLIIKSKQLSQARPLLEAILSSFGRLSSKFGQSSQRQERESIVSDNI
jgi:radical SAM superfamily enzyme YgiQ (UPF0313 family)